MHWLKGGDTKPIRVWQQGWEGLEPMEGKKAINAFDELAWMDCLVGRPSIGEPTFTENAGSFRIYYCEFSPFSPSGMR